MATVLISSPAGTVLASTGGEAAPSPDLVPHVVPREDQPDLRRQSLHSSHGRSLALPGLQYEAPGTVEVEGGDERAPGVESSHHIHGRHL